MRYCLEITSVPIPRDSNPLTAPAMAIAARLQPGEELEFRLHRDAGRIRCHLAANSDSLLAHASLILPTSGYTYAASSRPAAACTSTLLTRVIQSRYLLTPGETPVQMNLPEPIEFDAVRAESLFAALKMLPDNCGISFFFRRRAPLSLNTVTHLHRMQCEPNSLIHKILYANRLFETVGCVYGPERDLPVLTEAVAYALPAFTGTSIPCRAVDEGLLSLCHPAGLPERVQDLAAIILPEEIAALTDLRPSAGRYGLPLNKDTLFGLPYPLAPMDSFIRLGFRATGDPVDMPLSDLRRHVLLTATPGQGKGNMIFSFALQLHNAGIPFLLIEAQKCEQHTLRREIPDLQVWQPKEGEFVFNPFSLPHDITLGEYRSSLLTMLRQAFSLDGPLEHLFADALNRTFARKNYTDDSTSMTPDVIPFGLNEFMEEFSKLLDEQNYSSKTQQDVKTAGLVRLQTLFNQNRGVFDTVRTIPLEQLLCGENLLQLNCLSGDARQMFASLLLLGIGSLLQLRGKTCTDRPVQLVVIVDEAHALLGQAEDAQGKTYSFAQQYSQMLLTLRSIGIGFVTVTQMADSVPGVVADVCETKLFLGSSPYSGVADYRAVLHADDTAMENLYLLNPGEGIYCKSTLPSGVYFKSPNIIDSFGLNEDYPRHNDYLAANPRLTLETFAECTDCPTRGLCTHEDKITARQCVAILLSQLTPFLRSTDLEKRKDGEKRLLSCISQKAKETPRRFCILNQFIRDFNRTFPSSGLRAASLRLCAKKNWL